MAEATVGQRCLTSGAYWLRTVMAKAAMLTANKAFIALRDMFPALSFKDVSVLTPQESARKRPDWKRISTLFAAD